MFQAMPTAGDIIEEERKLQASLLVFNSTGRQMLLSRLSEVISRINQVQSQTIH